MRFPIDVLYLDQERIVIHIEEELKPWRMAAIRVRGHVGAGTSDWHRSRFPHRARRPGGYPDGASARYRGCMSTVETIPQSVDQWPEPPRLLVEWSSPWEEFKTALRPALRSSPKHLAGEAPIGMFPYRGMLLTWVLECAAAVSGDRDSRPYCEPSALSPHRQFRNGTLSTTPATNSRGPRTRAARRRASRGAPEARKPTIARRRSAWREAPRRPRKLSTHPSSTFRVRILPWRICWRSSRFPDRRRRRGCARRSTAPALPPPTVVPPTPELNSTLTPQTGQP